jgi:hypothetical protein
MLLEFFGFILSYTMNILIFEDSPERGIVGLKYKLL